MFVLSLVFVFVWCMYVLLLCCVSVVCVVCVCCILQLLFKFVLGGGGEYVW